MRASIGSWSAHSGRPASTPSTLPRNQQGSRIQASWILHAPKAESSSPLTRTSVILCSPAAPFVRSPPPPPVGSLARKERGVRRFFRARSCWRASGCLHCYLRRRDTDPSRPAPLTPRRRLHRSRGGGFPEVGWTCRRCRASEARRASKRRSVSRISSACRSFSGHERRRRAFCHSACRASICLTSTTEKPRCEPLPRFSKAVLPGKAGNLLRRNALRLEPPG